MGTPERLPEVENPGQGFWLKQQAEHERELLAVARPFRATVDEKRKAVTDATIKLEETKDPTDEIKPVRDPLAYHKRSVYTTIMDGYRRSGKAPPMVSGDKLAEVRGISFEDIVARGQQPDAILPSADLKEFARDKELLLGMLELLPQRDGKLQLMRFIWEMPYAEIAARLGDTQINVRRQTTRSQHTLKRLVHRLTRDECARVEGLCLGSADARKADPLWHHATMAVQLEDTIWRLYRLMEMDGLSIQEGAARLEMTPLQAQAHHARLLKRRDGILSGKDNGSA
ncbi:MAG: hypothetical protein ACKVVP_18490 [Chloroflexota bacterium]